MRPVGRRVRLVIVPVLALVCLGLLLVGVSGCIPMEGEEPPEWLGVETSETVETVGAEEAEVPAPGDAHHGNEVLMMGRSVMEGLFQYWGWDGEGPVSRDGYTFY